MKRNVHPSILAELISFCDILCVMFGSARRKEVWVWAEAEKGGNSK